MFVRSTLRSAFAALVSVACLCLPAQAQTYPTRPVRFILPVVAGDSTDVVARLVGEHLSRVFGQQFIVDNRSGAGGTAPRSATPPAKPGPHSHSG